MKYVEMLEGDKHNELLKQFSKEEQLKIIDLIKHFEKEYDCISSTIKIPYIFNWDEIPRKFKSLVFKRFPEHKTFVLSDIVDTDGYGNEKKMIDIPEKEKSLIADEFLNHAYSIQKLSKKYKHSKTAIRTFLISILGLSRYNGLILERKRKNFKMTQQLNRIEISQEEKQNIIKDFKKADFSLEILSKKYHHRHDKITDLIIDEMGEIEYNKYILIHRSNSRRNEGQKNPNWRGGISSKENIFYSSKEWNIIKKKIIKRDSKNCQLCGKEGIEVHHIIPRRLCDDDSLSNLVLLCRSCHRSIEILTSNFIERYGITPLIKLQISEGSVFRKTLQRVGFDIFMVNDETIASHKFKKLKTNLRFPNGLNDLFAILTLRSSYQDSGLILPSGIGIIDGDYTDKIFITVYNITDEPIKIKKKERIAQLVFFKNISRHIILENENNDIELIWDE